MVQIYSTQDEHDKGKTHLFYDSIIQHSFVYLFAISCSYKDVNNVYQLSIFTVLYSCFYNQYLGHITTINKKAVFSNTCYMKHCYTFNTLVISWISISCYCFIYIVVVHIMRIIASCLC